VPIAREPGHEPPVEAEQRASRDRVAWPGFRDGTVHGVDIAENLFRGDVPGVFAENLRGFRPQQLPGADFQTLDPR
jgi:hypothetical protein